MSQSPTKTAASLRRITRHLTISRAERTAYLSSAAAVALTVLMVGSGRVAESNPGSAWLIDTVGLQAWALSTPLALYLVFALYRFTARREHELTRVVAWATAGAVTLDAVGNLAATAYLGGVGSSVSLVVPSGVLALAGVLAFRQELADCSSTLPTPSASSVRTVGFAALIVVSAVTAPVSLMGDVSPVGEASATAVDWTWTTGGTDLTGVAVNNADGEVYIADFSNGDIKVLDKSTGSVLDTFNAHGTNNIGDVAYDSERGVIISVGYGGNVVATNLDGTTKWSHAKGGQPSTISLDESTGEVYVTDTSNDDIYAYNPDGSVKWSRAYTNPWGVAHNGSNVYVSHYNGLDKLSKSDGANTTLTSDAADAEDVGFLNNHLYLSSDGSTELEKWTTSGALVWNTSVGSNDGGSITASPATDEIWVGMETSGRIRAFNESGSQIYSTNKHADSVNGLAVDNSGSTTHLYTASTDLDAKRIDTDRALPSDVTGTVTTQTGAPVANATVRIAAVNHSKSSINDKSDAEQYIRDLVPDVPQNLTKQRAGEFELTGPAGFAEQQDTNVGFVHSRDDLNAGQLSVLPDNADLTNPLWEGIPAQKRMMVTCLDPTETGGLAGTGIGQNEYDRQLPGTFQRDCHVEFTQLAGVDDVGTITVGMNKTSQSNDLDPSKLPYGTVSLPAGWYRVQTSAGDASYVIQVGDPTRAIFEELQNQQGADIPSVAEVKDGQANGKFVMQTTTTDANGNFSLTISDPDLKTVGIQAYKAPSVDVAPKNLRLSDIRGAANANNLNQSVYLPSKVYTADVPSNGTTVRMTEASWSPHGNLSEFQSRWQALLDAIQNGSWSSLPPAMQQRLDNVSRDSLEETFTEMDELRKRNARLEDAYERAIARDGGDTTVEINPDSVSRDELERRTRALQQSISEVESSIESDNPSVSPGGQKVSLSFPFDADLSEADVLVRAHFNNGTSRTLPTSSDYVSIETNALTDDVVKVTDYPIGDMAATHVEFEVDVATAEGIGSASGGAFNPAFNGSVPSLSAVEFSTLRPGPAETVSVELEPESSAKFGSLTGAAVFGPGGTQIATTSKPGAAFEFTTSGHGVHRLQLTFTNPGGTEFTEVVTLKAGTTNQEWPAAIRTVSGPTGEYALVGDESNTVQSGAVDVRDGDSVVDVTATIGASADPPTDLHVYTTGVKTAADVTTSVSLRRTDDTPVEKNVLVTVHGPAIADNALVYRNGDPLPREGSPYGEVDAKGNKTVYKVITDANGEVALRVSSDPGLIERARYWVATTVPFDVPSLLTFPAGTAGGAASAGGLLLSVGLLARRRQ